jgi:MFS superfamily sulfate permease-like transporter
VKKNFIRRIPGPMMVLLVAVPVGMLFDLEHEHNYYLSNHLFHVGPNFLIRLPSTLASSIAFPDFSAVFSFISLKYIAMFTLVGSIESLLSVSAVDSLDPGRRSSDMNRDLLATGIGNALASALGGLPMISEIVRSKANIDNGAKSHLSNFFHGLFLLLSLALIPGVLQQIPLAALAAMLIYTGLRLASPKEFMHVYRVGAEQLLLFVVTMLVTLATDLLVGVALGIVLDAALHIRNGARLSSLFRAIVKEERNGDELILRIHESAIFTNFLGLKRRLAMIDDSVKVVIIDFDNAWVIDHTVLGKLRGIERSWTNRELILTGLDDHESMSNHDLSARKKARTVAA